MSILKTLRLEAGYTQRELADCVGMNIRKLQGYERGDYALENMTAANFIRLTDALKVDPHELLQLND